MNIELLNSFICQICKKVYDKPVFMPCFNTICSIHTINYENEATNKFECQVCLDSHPIPQKGFTENKMIASMLNMKVHLTTEAKACEDDLKTATAELEALFEDFQAKQRDCDSQNMEHFSEIKKQISFKVLNAKKFLDTLEVRLCQQVDKCQERSMAKLKDIKNLCLVSDLNQELLRETAEKHTDYFRSPNLDINQLNEFKRIVNSEIDILKKNLTVYDKEKNKILNECSFIPSEIQTQKLESLLGALKIPVINQFFQIIFFSS
jgi:hypothetical protein